MSTSTFESNIKQISHKQESVYRTLSDLNNLQMLKDRFEQVKDQIPEDKRKEMEKLKDLKFDSDFSQAGICLPYIERSEQPADAQRPLRAGERPDS